MPSYPPRQCEDNEPKMDRTRRVIICDDRVTYSRIIVDAHLLLVLRAFGFSRRLEPSLRRYIIRIDNGWVEPTEVAR